MSATVPYRWFGLGLIAFAPGACALAGYDFGDYERAAVNSAAAGAAGEANAVNPFSTRLSSSGAAGEGGAGAMPPSEGGAGAMPPSEGGAGAMPPSGEPSCAPESCLALGVECGPIPASARSGQCPAPAGAPAPAPAIDCGACFWWFQECRQNHCVIPE